MNKYIKNIFIKKQKMKLLTLIKLNTLNFLVLRYKKLLYFYGYILNCGRDETYIYGLQETFRKKYCTVSLYYAKDKCFIMYPIYCLSIYCYSFI